MKNRQNRGFTLVEILVVIAVIAIISSVVMSYVFSATVRGRDSRRKQNVDQVVKAIGLFFNENGFLPRNETGWCTYISNTTGGYGPSFQNDLLPYMKTMQFDPTKKGMVGDYLYKNVDNVGGHFVVCANLEIPTGNSFDHTTCLGGSVYNYCITQ